MDKDARHGRSQGGKIMLTFEDLTLENFSKLEKQILESELVFAQPIRGTHDEFVELLSAEGSLAKIAKFDCQYIGNIAGYPAEEDDLENCANTSGKTIYIYNIVINPPFQGKGYGFQLLKEFIRCAKETGYNRLIGYFRSTQSLALIKKMGAKEGHVEKNWYDTGEDYVFCELDI